MGFGIRAYLYTDTEARQVPSEKKVAVPFLLSGEKYHKTGETRGGEVSGGDVRAGPL
jgi:hypothetical protein